ncbi:MAG: CapA family protein [Jatrophihabitans sp.]|uniref:CapA family protein n=1 Tax=Jatrophihabitans sp. TaxID=1932789 RepID=UPI003F8014D3
MSRRAVALVVAAVALCVGCTSGSTPFARTTAGATPDGRSTTVSAPSSSTSGSVAPPTEQGRFTMAFAGDVHFMDQVGERLARDPATVFGADAAMLRGADLTMVNLETAITTGGDPQNKLFTFRAPPSALTALRDAGVDVATMANNHGADYGDAGLRDTFAAIASSHFPVLGIGPDADHAFAPYRTTLHGVKVAIFAADQVQDETTLPLFSAGPHKAGVANAYEPRLITAVRRSVAAGYVTVVYLHWGIEYRTCPSTDQTSLASALAAAGASAVIGTHAHVLQGAGWLPGGTYVAYGLGNYLWWRTFGNEQDDNGVLTLDFDHAQVVGARFAPSHLTDSGVSPPATGAERRRILAEWDADRRCTDLAATPPH